MIDKVGWKKRLVAAALLFAYSLFAAELDFSSRIHHLLSGLQAMGEGGYTAEEWEQALREVDGLIASARQHRAWEDYVEVVLIKAMVFTDRLRRYEQALKLVRSAREELDPGAIPAMRKLYVREAQILSRMGDWQAIDKLIEEFTKSSAFDPANYKFSGGKGLDKPLKLTRPGLVGPGSVVVSVMRLARKRAALAPGLSFPRVTLHDLNGRPYDFKALPQPVVIVDFWNEASAAWRRDIPVMKRLYRQYLDDGLLVIGIYVGRDPNVGLAFARQQELPWPLVMDQDRLAVKMGYFGETPNFILNHNGIIQDRELRGSQLANAALKYLKPATTE